MASTVRSLAGVLLRRSPAMETARRTVCRLSEVTVFKASSVPDLPSQKSCVMAPLDVDFDMFDPDADYPDPAESLSILAPLNLSVIPGDLCSTKPLSEAPRYAALRALKADAEAGTVLDYIPCLSETAIDKTNEAASDISESLPPSPAEPLRKLSPPSMNISTLAFLSSVGSDHMYARAVSNMAGAVQIQQVSVLPTQLYGTTAPMFQARGSIPMFSSLARSHFGRRMLCTAQAKGNLNKFEDFEKLYQKDRVYMVAGLDHISSQLCVLKDQLDLVKDKTDQSDFIQKWVSDTAKDTFELSEAQIEGVENLYTVGTYVFGFVAWGTLFLLCLRTVKENDIPFRDYSLLLNSVRVQALQRGIDHYKHEKEIRDELEIAKVEKAAALKKAVDEAASEKKAKEAEAHAERMAKLQQARVEWKAKWDQAGSVKKANAKAARDMRLAEWKKAKAVREEAAVARKVKMDQAAAARKLKSDQAIAARMAKAKQQAAAAAAAAAAKKAKV